MKLLVSHQVMSDSLWSHELQHIKFPDPSQSPGVCSNSCPLGRWCYLTISSSAALFSFCLQSFPALESFPLSHWCYLIISSSAALFSFCLQSFPASGSFPRSQLFASGGQSIGASASVLPINIQSLFPLGLTDLMFLLLKGLSRVLSNTTIHKHQFFGTQPSLWPSSHILT